MSARWARVLVRLSAWLVPRDLRPRWREEWLAEINACENDLGGRFTKNVKRPPRSFRRALGAPWDALAARRLPGRRPAPRTFDLAGWRTDLRQTLRTLARSPGHVAAVVASLGVGIAVSVSAFSAINALLFGDIPGLRDRATLARVFIGYDGVFGAEGVAHGEMVFADSLATSDVEILEERRQPALAGLAAEGDFHFAVSLDGRAAGTSGAFVSAQYFDVLGTVPALGRLLAPGDDRSGAPPVVVLGYHLWRDRFDARPDIVGHPVFVGGRPFTVVGVAPPRFTGIRPADIGSSPLDYAQLWLPLHHATSWPGAPARDDIWHSVVARVAPGFSKDDLQAGMAAAAAHIAAARPDIRRKAYVVVRSHGFGLGELPLEALLAVVLFLSVPVSVLAIGCANVANLQLARATHRAREIAVRLALGASRARLVRVLSLEACLLTALAAVAGWLGATYAIVLAADFFPLPLALDWRVLAFALALAAGATLLSGLAPAWLVTRRSMSRGLRPSGRGGGVPHARLRHALVVAQIALSLILLFVTASSVRSVQAMTAAVPDSARRLLVVDFALDQVGYDSTRARQFMTTVLDAIRGDGRIRAAAFADFAILGDGSLRYWTAADSDTIRRYSGGGAVTPRWFDAVGARLLAGRTFAADDEGASVAVISQSMADTLAANGVSALGVDLRLQHGANVAPRLVRVIGVVTDPPRRPDGGALPSIYVPMPPHAPTSVSLIVSSIDNSPAAAFTRSSGADVLIPDLRAVIAGIDPRLPWVHAGTAADLMARDISPVRYVALSIGGLGTLALLLATGGLYAVMAYVVSLRSHELGVRLAIGARPADVVAMVLRQAVRLVALGAIAGLAVALPLGYAMRAFLVGVLPVDPLAILPPLAVLLIAAITAGAVPARRAARIDPIRALRED